MHPIQQSAIDKNKLPDLSSVKLDKAIPQKERIARMLALTPDPHCFRYGDVGVRVEFTDNGPSLQDTLTNFLMRQKSGL